MFERTFSGVLGPHFAQLKHIGGGGSGSVYSGVDTRYDFPVCIKRISVSNKDDCRAALREIRIRRRLKHENIVGLLNAITADGTDISEIPPANFRDTSCIYLVQELRDADLRQVIESNNRLTDDYVKLFFYQLLRGLKYIHSANVLHRDLKPSNVVINVNSLELMISDFGHSMVLDPEYNHSNCLNSCGTSLWYKAPELIVGSSRYSTASDMWAAGCVLAEMLLGRPLFEGENDLEQLELIIHTIQINDRDQLNVRQYLTEEVNKMYTGRPKFPLHSKFQKVDSHALHLLEHLLSFNAGDRVTAELALSHPFLHEYSCTTDEPVCLKPLHLEHEVDDFLEYTLKDLIVGECVALAEEQPRIHMQMSSYSSLMDIVKELNNSPSEPASPSIEDGKTNIAIKVTSDNGENEGGGDGRFKVLEVLKEEHISSCDSNGITQHEEGVSEEPLVSDHAMFSSQKWENERHKFGHRRHHNHHRRKMSGDESSRSRKRKISPGNKVFKSPSSEHEMPWGLVPGDAIAGNHTPGRLSPENNTSGDQSFDGRSQSDSCLSLDRLSTRGSDHSLDSELAESQDDKVQELINKSCQLIAEHAFDGETLAISKAEDPNPVQDAPETTKIENLVTPCLETRLAELPAEEGHGTLDHLRDDGSSPVATDAGVVGLIRRSRELCGDAIAAASREVSSDGQVKDSVKDLILKSEQLLGSPTGNIGPETAEQQGHMRRNEDQRIPECMPENCHPFSVENGTDYNQYILQPILSDPYHLRESNRRMQELLEESHLLLSSLRTDKIVSTGLQIPPSEYEDESSKCTERSLVPSDMFESGVVEFQQREHCLVGVSESLPTVFSVNETELSQALGSSVDGEKQAVQLPFRGKASLVAEDVTPDNFSIVEKPDGESEEAVVVVGHVSQPETQCKKITQCNSCLVFLPDQAESCAFNQRAVFFEVVTVRCSVVSEEKTLVKNCVLHRRKPSRSDHEERTGSSKHPEREKHSDQGTPDKSTVEQRIVDSVKQNPGETGVNSSDFSLRGADLYCALNSLTYDEINVRQNKNNHTPEDASKKNNYGNKSNVEETKDEIRKRANSGSNGNGVKLQDCFENSNESLSNKNTSGFLKDQKLNISNEKQYTANDVSVGTYCNGTIAKSPRSITEKLTSGDLIGKYNGRSDKTTKDQHVGPHAKDDAGLRTFYANLRLKSLMNRTYRDKRHEPYLF